MLLARFGIVASELNGFVSMKSCLSLSVASLSSVEVISVIRDEQSYG